MNVIHLRPRIVASTEAVALEMLSVLRAVADWMDSPQFKDCPVPNPLASEIRIAVAKAKAHRGV